MSVAPTAPLGPARAAAAEPRPPCAALLELVEAARATFPRDALPEASPCVAGDGGAYALAISYTGEVTSPAADSSLGVRGECVLLHLDAAGKLARSRPWHYEASTEAFTHTSLEGSADFDGDGTAELLTSTMVGEFEGSGRAVWQVVGETIVEYPPANAFSIGRFEDVDTDGLPDLVTTTSFEGRINGCGADGLFVAFGPDWVAHARRDGTFAFDEVSREVVRRTCPERPRSIVPVTPEGVDNDELRRRVACAVVWGGASAAIVHELKRSCPPAPSAPVDECAYQGTLPTCINPQQLALWAGTKLPFQLP